VANQLNKAAVADQIAVLTSQFPTTSPLIKQNDGAVPLQRTAVSAQVQFPRRSSYVIQRFLNDAGERYLQYIQTDFTYGGYAEAHAIASALGFTTHIFEMRNNTLHLLTSVGAGPVRNFSLYWDRQAVHYQVLAGNAALNNQPFNEHLIAHNPKGDGNCMYEALYYIANYGGNELSRDLREPRNAMRRVARIRGMRSLAARNFDPLLANILGEEVILNEKKSKPKKLISSAVPQDDLLNEVLNVYKAYPPKDYYLKDGDFYSRSEKNKKVKAVNVVLRDDLKLQDKKQLRESVMAALEQDRSYYQDRPVVSKSLAKFDRTNSNTWNMINPDFIDGVTEKEVNTVILSGSDRRYYADILTGVRTTNSSSGGAVIGAPYHSHMANNGGGGVAFYYRHVKNNDVQAVFYAVANNRNSNNYVWNHNYGTSNSHPVRKNGYV